MFEDLLELFSPENEEPIIGYFVDTNKERKLALVESFAINQQVYGLEIVFTEANVEVENYPAGLSIETIDIELYLTQHEFPRSRIDRAINLLKMWRLPKKLIINKIDAPISQANLRRYLVTFTISRNVKSC
jgi:hypothetical protein